MQYELIYKFNGCRSKPFPLLWKTEKKNNNCVNQKFFFIFLLKLKLNFVRQFIHPIFNSQNGVFKLFNYQEWLTSSSWMGDDCASTSPVIPHPPFHLHELPTLLLLPLGECATAVAMAASSCEKKNLKIPKKTSYCILCTLKCTKS